MPGLEKIRGHLEKKKDWIRRARDHHEKAEKIKQLKRKARERNPDEFSYHMLRSQVGLDGVHRDLESENEDDSNEVQKLLSDIGDIKYVNFHLGKEKKKIEKLRNALNFYVESPNKHIIFADDEQEAKEFDPVKHFGTSEQFLGRTFNRPKKEQSDKLKIDAKAMKNLEDSELERRRLLEELEKRMERERELEIVLRKLEVKRDIALSRKSELKPKAILKGNKQRAAVYKWTFERKK